MLWLQRHGGAKGVLPCRHRLTRQAVDQIKAQIVKTGHPGRRHRREHLIPRMYPADAAQKAVVRRLHAQRNAVEARPAQRAQRLPVPGAVGVGLQRDLRAGGHMIALFHGFQQLCQPLFPQIAGGAAAEIHRVRRVGGAARRHLLQMADQGGGIGVHLFLAVRQGVKIAIGALTFAKRDMEVQSQRLFHQASSFR